MNDDSWDGRRLDRGEWGRLAWADACAKTGAVPQGWNALDRGGWTGGWLWQCGTMSHDLGRYHVWRHARRLHADGVAGEKSSSPRLFLLSCLLSKRGLCRRQMAHPSTPCARIAPASKSPTPPQMAVVASAAAVGNPSLIDIPFSRLLPPRAALDRNVHCQLSQHVGHGVEASVTPSRVERMCQVEGHPDIVFRYLSHWPPIKEVQEPARSTMVSQPMDNEKIKIQPMTRSNCLPVTATFTQHRYSPVRAFGLW